MNAAQVMNLGQLLPQTARLFPDRAALYRGPARKFVLCLCPALVAGAVLTWALWARGAADLIPGTWLLLYGCGVTAAATMTMRPVAVMGGLFLVLGITALLLPPQHANVLLGAGFGGLHVIFGAFIRWKTHEHQSSAQAP